MNTTLKQWLTLVLMLFIQMQPLQVHALVLETEQSGHIAGQLSHSHGSHNSNVSDVDSNERHQTECHPSHILFSAESGDNTAVTMRSIRHRDYQPTFTSVDLALDLPPPRQNSI